MVDQWVGAGLGLGNNDGGEAAGFFVEELGCLGAIEKEKKEKKEQIH